MLLSFLLDILNLMGQVFIPVCTATAAAIVVVVIVVFVFVVVIVFLLLFLFCDFFKAFLSRLPVFVVKRLLWSDLEFPLLKGGNINGEMTSSAETLNNPQQNVHSTTMNGYSEWIRRMDTTNEYKNNK